MLLDKRDAANFLKISIESLDKYRAQGKIAFVKIGDRVLFTQNQLDEFVDNCVVLAKEPPSRREALAVVKGGKL